MKIRLGFVSNSSSEAFLCSTDYSLAVTKGILINMLNFYNSMFNTELEFDEVFDEPRIFTTEDDDCLKSFGEPYESVGPEKFTQTLIVSCEDNSIPYELFDFIERKFQTNRIHLG